MTNRMNLAPTAELHINNQPMINSTRTLGAVSLGGNEARMISRSNDGEYAFFYGPGWHTKGEVIAKNLDRHMSVFGSTHFGVHPPAEYSIDLQKEAWIDARRKDGFRPAKIYAQSKAAMTVSHMFADPGFQYEFGQVDAICFDSPVSSRHDLHELPNLFMNIGRRLPDNPVVEKICRKVMELILSEKPDFDDTLLTLEEAKGNAAASTQTRLVACISQLEYLWVHDVADFDLSDFGSTVPNKKIISATNDKLVKLGRAAAVINASYGGGFEHWIDMSRRAGDHATGTERPAGVLDALNDRNPNNIYPVREIAYL